MKKKKKIEKYEEMRERGVETCEGEEREKEISSSSYRSINLPEIYYHIYFIFIAIIYFTFITMKTLHIYFIFVENSHKIC